VRVESLEVENRYLRKMLDIANILKSNIDTQHNSCTVNSYNKDSESLQDNINNKKINGLNSNKKN